MTLFNHEALLRMRAAQTDVETFLDECRSAGVSIDGLSAKECETALRDLHDEVNADRNDPLVQFPISDRALVAAGLDVAEPPIPDPIRATRRKGRVVGGQYQVRASEARRILDLLEGSPVALGNGGEPAEQRAVRSAASRIRLTLADLPGGQS